MGTDVATYDKQMAEMAQQYASKETISSSFLSTAGGVFKLGDEEVDGNKLVVVIAGFVFENTYYGEQEWDPDRPSPPVCFALDPDEDEMGPHPSMQADLEYFQPQHDQCKGCPMNEFGTALRGKGKACKNRRRLALLPAGYMEPVEGVRNAWAPEIIEDADHYATAEMVMLKLSPTSLKAFSAFVRKCSSDYSRPPFAVIAEIGIQPGTNASSGGHSFTFDVIGEPDASLFPTLMKRNEDALKLLTENTYSAPDSDQPRRNSRLGGLRR